MKEKTLKIKFKNSRFVIAFDSRSFTLRKENKPNDKFPTPLGYHISIYSLANVAFKQAFATINGDIEPKKFLLKVKELWEKDVLPFLDTMHAEQKKLTEEQSKLLKELIVNKEEVKDYKKLVELVYDGKNAQAKTLATKIKEG